MTQTAPSPIVTQIPAGTWNVDPAHSSIEFGIKHLLITTVKGTFADFDGTIEIREDGTGQATGTIRAASIDTHEPQRDEHLRSPEFFDAAAFPEIRFESKYVGGGEGSSFDVVGDLTIRGITRQLELDATFEGTARDPWGNERIGVTLRGQLDPNDYGVDWNQELETGGNLVGDRAEFTVNVSAIKHG